MLKKIVFKRVIKAILKFINTDENRIKMDENREGYLESLQNKVC